MHRLQKFEIMHRSSDTLSVLGKDRVIVENGKKFSTDTDLSRKIEEVWLREGYSHSGPKIRLSGYRLDNMGNLFLELAETNYKDFIGTNIEASRDPKYKQVLIDRGLKRFNDPYAFFANLLGLNCVVETSDEKIIVGLRNEKTRSYPHYWHLIAGSADKTDGNEIDLFHGMSKELEEELFLSTINVKSMGAIGLVRNTQTMHPAMIFYSQIDLKFDEVLYRQKTESEHGLLKGLEKEEISEFILHERMVPDGEAGLLVYLASQGIVI